MMRHMDIAWKNIIHSRRQTIAVSLLSLCAMALMIIGGFLGHSLQGGLTTAVEPFDMLAGYGGSYQMVLNTVFLQDYPAGNIPYHLVDELNADPRVERAIPLAFGDNYKGYRIVGTDAAIFSHFAKSSDVEPWLRFKEGTPFAFGSREAVVGCRVAADLALKIGDSLVSTHGFARGGDEHAHAPYVVSGILASCRGPYDQAVFVDLLSIWDAHGIHHDHDDSEKSVATEWEDEHPHEEKKTGEHDHDRHELLETDARKVTAIMVKPAGFADAYEIFTEFSGRHDADLVFPAQVIIRLLSILGQADWLLRAIGYAAGAIAAITIALSLYWSASSREGEALILRLIGAEKRDIVAILTWEGVLSIAPGLLAGCAAGHVILAIISGVLERKTSLHTESGLSWMDLVFGLLLLTAGILGEVFAALQMTRKTM